MSRLRLWRFVLVFAAIYGLLMLPWLDLKPFYGPYIRGFGVVVFGQSGKQFLASVKDSAVPRPPHVVLFRARGAVDPDWPESTDTMIVLMNSDGPGKPEIRAVGLDSEQIIWIQFSFFLALVGATPMPWSRRAWCLLWGVLAAHVHLLVFLKVVLASHMSDLSMIYLSPFAKAVVIDAVKLLAVVSGPSMLLYLFVWIFAAFRRQDLVRWVNGWKESLAPSGKPLPTRQQKRAQLRAAHKVTNET
jgi:hypothetical protein